MEGASTGRLFLCATPIGNLEDMTFRAVRILKEADLIAAEDTRNSIRLLNHFDIHTPMTSYHEYNKYDKGRVLVDKLMNGMDIALITDAGTPGISDPGEELVRMCREAGIEVVPVPGPAACIAALTASGLPAGRFAFEAFLPSEKKERQSVLDELREETRTIVLYEAPHRLARTLEELLSVLGDRPAVLCRELTKVHETFLESTLKELYERAAAEGVLGECVLVIRGADRKSLARKEQESWLALTVKEHVALYEQQGYAKKDAMKMAAADRGVTKREIYAEMIKNDTE